MAEKKEAPFPLSLEAPVPEIYMPLLQLFIRLLLGGLVAVYINYSPVPPLVLSVNQVNLSLVFYYAFHLFWWWYYRTYGANIIMFRLGGWIDILGAFVGALSDPFTIPPMILLFLIAVLGNGIQHGLYFFVESMIGSLILAGAVLVIHCGILGAWAKENGLQTGVSFGLAAISKGKNNLDDILRQADAALYKAKPKEGLKGF